MPLHFTGCMPLIACEGNVKMLDRWTDNNKKMRVHLQSVKTIVECFPAHDELGTCRTSFAIHNSVGEWMSITDLLHGFLCKARKGLAPEVVVAQGEVGDVRG